MTKTVSPSDPLTLLAILIQFGPSQDSAVERDLAAAINRLIAERDEANVMCGFAHKKYYEQEAATKTAEAERDAFAAKLAEAERERDEARADWDKRVETTDRLVAEHKKVRFAAEASLARMREALEKADKALKPLSDAVFNDNGDMTVTAEMPTYDECVAAYFASRKARAALSEQGGADAPSTCSHPGWTFLEHGRLCLHCGTMLADLGD
jgi:hypothetical protein